jgi:hypothetical protein
LFFFVQCIVQKKSSEAIPNLKLKAGIKPPTEQEYQLLVATTKERYQAAKANAVVVTSSNSGSAAAPKAEANDSKAASKTGSD